MKRSITIGLACILLPAAVFGADKVERTFKAKCAACHGEDGKGQTQQGKKMGIPDFTTAAWQKEFTDAKIKEVIENGVNRMKDGKKKEMSPYKDKLKPEEIDGLVRYMRTLKK